MSSDHEQFEKVRRGRELIEEALQDLNIKYGVLVEQRMLSNGTSWWFNLRKNPVIVAIIETPDSDPDFEIAGIIWVDAYVAKLPTRNLLPLYRRLLELNGEVLEGSFAVNSDDQITFSVRRIVESVDSKEQLDNIIGMAALHRQFHVDDLANEFGCIPLNPWVFPTT